MPARRPTIYLMNLQIENKTALITGSTRGIGFAIARLLAEEGANIILNGRSEASVKAAVAQIGRRARGVAADVSTAAGCAALVRSEERRVGNGGRAGSG